MEIVIGNQFKIIKKIGAGSFGEIYEAVSIKRGNKVAVKLQNVQQKHQQLLYEAKVLTNLQGNDSIVDKGIPNIYSFGKQGQFNFIVMDLLGPSLEQLLQQYDGRFSLKTTLMLADQMVKRVQYMHSLGYVHRDIKPQNFLTSNNKERKIYLVDFGLAKNYKKDGKHIQYQEGKNMIGTVRYASLNIHYGIQLTRRDDLQSLFYCWCYFYMGQLPWQNQKAQTRKQKYEKIMGKKQENRPQILCKNFPIEFITILNHIKGLKFEQKPNYELIKNEIRKCMKEQNIEYDYQYDWNSSSNKL